MSMTARRARSAPASDPKKRRIIRLLGPGLITGASDDDPSGIATYSQAGAQFGFAISWTMLFSYPLMVAIQQISARIGRTTGKGIAGNLRQHYPNWLLQGTVALLFVANTINIGADLGAMADALGLLIGGPRLIYVIAFGSLCAVLQVFMTYIRYVAVLKWLTLALFAYFGTVMVVEIPWPEAARGFLLPTFRSDVAFWTTVVAVLGTTVSPYLFFWQAAQEVEDIRVEPERKQRTLSSFQRRSKAHVRAIVEAVAALGAQPAVLEFKVLQALHLPRSGCLPTVMQFI
jgi:NRAMP (natural resistance-associated macrophage protein)-like metal ion transporter